MIYALLTGLALGLAWIALVLALLVPVLRDGRTPARTPGDIPPGWTRNERGALVPPVPHSPQKRAPRHAAPRTPRGRQPWPTAEQPALPAPPPQHAYDPGDGILPPVALVRPYLPDAYRCCEHCWDGSPCSPRDNHRTPCADGCNDPAPCTDAETLAMYRGDYGVKPQLEAERLAGVMRP